MARRIFGFGKLLTISGFSVASQAALPRFVAKCQEVPTTDASVTSHVVISIGDDELEDKDWLLEKEKCSFCKFFLGSPCRNHFIKWSKCVDLAKSKELDFVKSCSVYTKALMDCTSANDEYFSKAREQAGNSDEEDEEDEEEPANVDNVEEGDEEVVDSVEVTEVEVTEESSSSDAQSKD
jgi:hypothetical protein